jgi:LysM repeat protein
VQRYVVEPGDTLKSIASRFGVSVEAILRFNGLSEEDGDSLGVGQELFIPPQ